MTVGPIAACTYAVLAVAPALVQLALVFGAPWGHLTMGGHWPGRLPPAVRSLAALQCALLVAMATVVLGAGGVLAFTSLARLDDARADGDDSRLQQHHTVARRAAVVDAGGDRDAPLRGAGGTALSASSAAHGFESRYR